MNFQKWKLISSEFNYYQEFLILHSEILKKIKEKHFAHTFEKKLLNIFSLWSLHIFLRSFKFFVHMYLNKKKNHWNFFFNVHKKYIVQKIFVHTFWINIGRNHWKCSFVHKFWNIWKSLKTSFVHIFSFEKLVHIFWKHCLWKVHSKNHHL